MIVKFYYVFLLQGTRNPKEVVIMTVHDLGCDRKCFTNVISYISENRKRVT